jgi:hypothetical protein
MSPARHLVFAGSLAALAVASSACAGSRQTVRADPFGAGTSEQVLLTVHNNDFRDAVVYAYWNGLKQRVGMVTGTKSQTFTLRWQGEWIELGIDFIGTVGETRSERIGVTQGDHLDYVILGTAR